MNLASTQIIMSTVIKSGLMNGAVCVTTGARYVMQKSSHLNHVILKQRVGMTREDHERTKEIVYEVHLPIYMNYEPFRKIKAHRTRAAIEFGRTVPRHLQVKKAKIDKLIEKKVLRRDAFTCQMCGAGEDESSRLTVAVFPPRSIEKTPEAIDLKTLCDECADGVATAVFQPRMNAEELLVQIRRATGVDQLEVLKWLLKKYPKQIQK